MNSSKALFWEIKTIQYIIKLNFKWFELNSTNVTFTFLKEQQQNQLNINPSKLFLSRMTRRSKIRIFYKYLYFCSKNCSTEKSQSALAKGLIISQCSILETHFIEKQLNLTVLSCLKTPQFVLRVHLIWWWQCVPVAEIKHERNIVNYRGRTVHWKRFLLTTRKRLLTNPLITNVMGANFTR